MNRVKILIKRGEPYENTYYEKEMAYADELKPEMIKELLMEGFEELVEVFLKKSP